MSGGLRLEGQDAPHTRASLARDLRAAGYGPGGTFLTHVSMSALGYIVGGEEALLLALLDALGPQGTLVLPAFSAANSEPAAWQVDPLPPAWWPVVRAAQPAFDPLRTPTWQLGRVPELFRTWPGVLRSAHPQDSFAAHGPNAERITAGHRLESPLGEGSPLARLYELDAWVALLGVDHGNDTSLHLAENRVPGAPQVEGAAAVEEGGARTWRSYTSVALDSAPFAELGRAFDAAHGVQPAGLGSGSLRLFRQRAVVDFGVEWLSARRR